MLRFGHWLINVYLMLQIISERLFVWKISLENPITFRCKLQGVRLVRAEVRREL